MSWRREFDQLLINAVQKYPYIYNVDMKEFRNECARTTAWQAIAQELGMDGELFTSNSPSNYCAFPKSDDRSALHFLYLVSKHLMATVLGENQDLGRG